MSSNKIDETFALFINLKSSFLGSWFKLCVTIVLVFYLPRMTGL